MFFIFMNKYFEFWNHMFIKILLELCENAFCIVILENFSNYQKGGKNQCINGKKSI